MTEHRYSQYFFILGEPIPRWKVYLSLTLVLMLIGGGAGFIYYIMLKNRSAAAPSAPAVVAPASADTARAAEQRSSSVAARPADRVQTRNRPVRVSTSESRSPLERLLEQHLKATGFDGVSSYFAEGTVGAQADYEIVLMARSPNLYKYKTKYPTSGVVIEFGYEGKGAWLRGNYPDLTREAAEYFTSLSLIEGSLTHLAWSYLSSDASEYGLDSVLELQSPDTWNGQTCAVVLSHGILPIPMYHYIDTHTFREVYRRAKLTNVDGDVVEVSITFDPPDESLHSSFPMGYELFIDGKLFDDVTFSKFRFDRVILSSLFDPSDDCTFTDLAVRP